MRYWDFMQGFDYLVVRLIGMWKCLGFCGMDGVSGESLISFEGAKPTNRIYCVYWGK